MSVIEEKLNYSKDQMASRSVLGVRRASPQGLTSVAITASGGDSFDIILAPAVIQPARCRLNLKLSLTAGGAGNFNWINTRTVPLFREVGGYLENGFELARILNHDQCLDAVLGAETSLDKVLHSQDFVESGSAMDFFHQSNNDTVYVANAPLSITTGRGAKYFIGTDFVNQIAGANTAGSVYVSLPFSMLFANSPLAEDRLVYIPRNLTLRFTMNPLSKIGFVSTSATDPTAGVGNLVGASLDELQMEVVYEKNPEIINGIMNAVSNNQMSFNTPYMRVLYNSQIPASTSQGVYLRLNSNLGDNTCRRIYTQLYNSTQSNGTAYDHSATSPYPTNLPNGTGAGQAGYVDRAQFLTAETLDNVPFYDYVPAISSTKPDDWRIMAPQLDGSSIIDLATYRAKWQWIRNFEGGRTVDKDYTVSKGVPLTQEVQYAYQFQTANLALVHFVVGVFQRRLQISRDGMAFVIAP